MKSLEMCKNFWNFVVRCWDNNLLNFILFRVVSCFVVIILYILSLTVKIVILSVVFLSLYISIVLKV